MRTCPSAHDHGTRGQNLSEMHVGWLVVLAPAAQQLTNGNLEKSYSYYAAKLYDHLLDGYCVDAPPVSNRPTNLTAAGLIGVQGESKAGADVVVMVTFNRIDAVDMASGKSTPPARVPETILRP